MSGADAVKEDRLWQRHVEMAKLGGTPKGGVNRQALSPEDAARAQPARIAGRKARGFAVFDRRDRQPVRAARRHATRRPRRC